MADGWLVIESRSAETIRELAERLDAQVVIRPIPGGGRIPEHRFYATMTRVEIMERGMLRSVAGHGITEQAALDELAEELSYERLAVGAYTPNRREVTVGKILSVEVSGG